MTSADLKQIQIDYHDWEAATYDEKFSIDTDQRCIDYAVGRFDRVMDAPVIGDVLELGGGTGFFSLNLALGERIGGNVVVTDLSPKMLDIAAINAASQGLDISTKVADAEQLPFDDASFDLVMGHAFLHHLPVPELALREALRVLRPGGRILFAGEPTIWGHRIAEIFKRVSWMSTQAITALGMRHLRRASHSGVDAEAAALESVVDLHEFDPGELARRAKVLGFDDARCETEELTANWTGWVFRTVDAALDPDVLGDWFHWTGYRVWRGLSVVDEQLRNVVPAPLFYNLILTGTRPTS